MGVVLDRTLFEKELTALGLHHDASLLDSFERFETALYQLNLVSNLTRVPQEECWVRHFLDSLLIAEFIQQGESVLDIGCGPGFPSWPLARVRPDLTVTALDSSGKMLGFLRTMPLRNLKIVQERAEMCGLNEKFDVVTGRALAPLAIQLELSVRPCRKGGRIVPMRTPGDTNQIESIPLDVLGLRLVSVESRVLPVAETSRSFPIFAKVASTAKRLPRTWADIKRAPLHV